MATILITDGEQRSALAIVRSLGRAGHRCLVGSGTGRSLAGRSCQARVELRLPDPAASPAEFGAAVRSAVERQKVDVVIPVSEPALLAVLAIRGTIPAAVPFPDIETFQAICDKERVLAAACELGIRVPRQQVIDAPAQARTLEARAINAIEPLVLKPARSVYTASDGTRHKVGVRWVWTTAELETSLRLYPSAAFPILVQERIVGPGVGIFLLVHNGECIARFSHFRVREKPPEGGVSVLCRSEPMDEDLLDQTLALLNRFGWSGVAMVEYKRDVSTGEAVLMEINGRFWGSLQLSIDAGVDFPCLLVDTALDKRVEPVQIYAFARTRWFWGDMDNLIARLREPEGTWRGRARALAGWLRAFGPGGAEEVFRWRDPLPFLHETRLWLRDVFRVSPPR
jgi:predicted ATP-grasp superfamily ATP-dependent carboligase